MTWQKVTGCAFLSIALAGPGFAQEIDPNLAGIVSAVTDNVEKTQVDGETVVLIGGDRVFFEDKVVTPAGGGVWLTLREKRGVVQLLGDSSASFRAMEIDEQSISLRFAVERGRATVMSRSSDTRPLLVVAGDVATGGWALVRGGTVSVDVSANAVTLSASSGEVLVYQGAVPEESPVQADGTPVNPPAHTLAPGESVSFADMAKGPAVAPADAEGTGLYAMGLRKADLWVAKAEQGDFTPQRVEARGGGGTFLEQTSTGFSFDQARPPVAVVTRTNTVIVTNIRVNPAEALVASRVPTSVVVGQRFLRTRIIGNPGSGDSSLSANPFAGRLIVLGN